MNYMSMLSVRCSLIRQLSDNPAVGRPLFKIYLAHLEAKRDHYLEKIQKTPKIRLFRRQSLRYKVTLLSEEIAILRKAWAYPKEKCQP